MEYLNKVEFAGVVGSVRINEFGKSKVANFSLCVESEFCKSDGTSIAETSWIQVVAWDVRSVEFESIEKGANLKVKGRFRTCSYTSADGTDRYYYDVLAYSVNKIQ